MVVMLSRRAIMGGACALLSPSVVPNDDITRRAVSADPALLWKPESLTEVAEVIVTYTPRTFREGVLKSKRFLYRGEESRMDINDDSKFGRICHPAPDLLQPGTYAEPDALAYFECLQAQLLYQEVRPSNGHLATPIVSEAAAWGNVFSIWPLGTEFYYAYPRYRTAFYNGKKSTCPGDKLQLDSGLKTALLEGREILFASRFKERDKKNTPAFIDSSWTSAFVAVPLEHDGDLMSMLEQKKYGLP